MRASLAAAGTLAIVLCLAPQAGQSQGDTKPLEKRAGKRVETAAIGPGTVRLPEAWLPPVLSGADAVRYARIFAAQRRGDWAKANREIARLHDRLLMGHVLAQRYLHPTAYRSTYGELRHWLKHYADHPQAVHIHALADARKPAGAEPPPAQAKLYGVGDIDLVALDLAKRSLSDADRDRARALRARLQNRLDENWPTGARQLLQSVASRKLFSELEYDHWLTRVAAGYFYAGTDYDDVDAKALELAATAAQRSGDQLPESHWIAGLAAWRLGRPAIALRHFSRLAKQDSAPDWLRAGAGFWAGRAAAALDLGNDAVHWLRGAGRYDRTFYGMLARRQLGLPISFSWTLPAPAVAEQQRIAATPHGRRAYALLQAGATDLAEQELRLLAQSGSPGLLASLAKVAERARLPALALQLAYRLRISRLKPTDATAYPLLPWQPQRGYQTDRALVHALVRQESAFRRHATSYAGARGLMQLMPPTASDMAKRMQLPLDSAAALYDPAVNLALGQRYLAHLLRDPTVEGDLMLMAAAYNAGPGNLRKWRKRADHRGDPLLFMESIPSAQTRQFIERVLTNLWIYRARLRQPTPSLDALAAGDWPRYVPLDAKPGSTEIAHAGN